MVTHLAQWTPEMDAAMHIGINNGLSASLIAAELGVTRNAVLGRRFRLGLCQTKKKPRKPTVTAPIWPPSRRANTPNPDNIFALGRAARACGFTVAELIALSKEFEQDGL